MFDISIIVTLVVNWNWLPVLTLTAGKDLLPTDLQYVDCYIVLMVHTLYDLHIETGQWNYCDDCYIWFLFNRAAWNADAV